MGAGKDLDRDLPDPRERSLHFIVGVPRSGTTLCRMLLGAHARICAPSETPWLFGPYGDDVSLAALLEVLRTSMYGPVKSIAGVSSADIDAAAEQFVLGVFASKMRAERKDVLILKTPDDIAFVDRIVDIFRNSIVIHVRRDVRDVALSTVQAGWPRLNLFGENTFENAVRRWIAWERHIDSARAGRPDRIISIRYEDLVLRPEQTLAEVLRRFGLSFVPAMLRYWEQAQGAPEWDLGSRNAGAFRSIEPARVFAYRRHVPDDAQRRAIAAHESDIVALGYAPGWDG